MAIANRTRRRAAATAKSWRGISFSTSKSSSSLSEPRWFESPSHVALALHLVPLPSSPLSESPYTTQIKSFYNALVYDTPVPVSAIDGLAALQISLAAIESARQGVPVTLEALPEVSP